MIDEKNQDTMDDIVARVAAQARGREIKIYTVNGYQIRGSITETGRGWVRIRTAQENQIVMTQAISTIVTEEAET